MEEIVKITVTDGVAEISLRDLHKALGLNPDYQCWKCRLLKKYDLKGRQIRYKRKEGQGRYTLDYMVSIRTAIEIATLSYGKFGSKVIMYLIDKLK